MGTRALVHVKEGGRDSRTLVTIYRQYDGYPFVPFVVMGMVAVVYSLWE
jgi:hypothetical protein